MAAPEEELQEMRCRCCGVFMGYRRRIGRFVFWCSEDCAETPMAKWDESQIRDETIVTMFLDGQGIMEISRNLNDWPYQYVQQILTRRGLLEWKTKEYIVKEHTRIKADGTEVTMPQHRLVRTVARKAS